MVVELEVNTYLVSIAIINKHIPVFHVWPKPFHTKGSKTCPSTAASTWWYFRHLDCSRGMTGGLIHVGIRGIMIIFNSDECYCFNLLGIYYIKLMLLNFITMMPHLRYYYNIIWILSNIVHCITISV